MQSLMQNGAFALHLGKESFCGADLPATYNRNSALRVIRRARVASDRSRDVARRSA
jgi:hypothetical protein